MKKIPHLRWLIVGMIFLASVLNYVDRQTLSILAPTIQRDLRLNDRDYAFILNLFLTAYTLAYLFSGWLVDRIGVRLSFALYVGGWSLANMLTGFARTAFSFGAFRFFLGLGEAGNWTAGPKAVSEWFPARERGVAIGIYTVGATLGATLAPIIIIALSSSYSWRAPFVMTGFAGLIWILPWLWLYRAPRRHPRLTETESRLIGEDAEPDQPEPAAEARPAASAWKTILRRPEVWKLMAARLLTDPVWYFYQFWFAKYLFAARGLSQKSLSITWVIFFAADIGALAGGWFSGSLIRRGQRPAAGRLWIMLAAACLAPLSALIPNVQALWLVLGMAMVTVFAQMAWLINLTALAVDVLPARVLATAFGLIAAGSAAGGILMNWGVGRLVSNGSYDRGFLVIAFLHPLALVLLWPIRRLGAEGKARLPAASPA